MFLVLSENWFKVCRRPLQHRDLQNLQSIHMMSTWTNIHIVAPWRRTLLTTAWRWRSLWVWLWKGWILFPYYFFYSWPTPAHPFVDPFFSTSLGSCNVSGKRTTGRATCNWLRTRRRTCLATGARSFSSKQVRQTAKNIWSNNSKNIANSMGGVSSLFPAGMTSFVDSMQVHPQLMSDCSGAEGAWWALKKVFPQSELVSSCLDKISILFPWIINLVISPGTKILLLGLGACSNPLFSGVTMPWGLWSSSCAMLHPKWSSAIS